METRNILDIAEALTMGALARQEFRGAHWRKERQERDDENWLKHTLVSWNDGEPEPMVQADDPRRREQDVRTEDPLVLNRDSDTINPDRSRSPIRRRSKADNGTAKR